MSEKIKIAVLVSGGGTNLQALIDAEKSGIIKSGEIALVVSNNIGAFALTRAENAGIKNIVIPECSGQAYRMRNQLLLLTGKRFHYTKS